MNLRGEKVFLSVSALWNLNFLRRGDRVKYVILAGGSGSRLWPWSRDCFPKQFLSFGGNETFLQKTVARFYPKVPVRDIVVVTARPYFHLVKQQLCALDPSFETQIIIEPAKRNTAPAICLALAYFQEVLEADSAGEYLVCSSDHMISPVETFLAAIRRARKALSGRKHVIFGIYPTRPETGYGYVKIKSSKEAIQKVEQFVEKPDLETAKEYLLSGRYLWNAGIFLFRADFFLKELKTFCPQIRPFADLPFIQMLSRFEEMPDISVDYALMEKSSHIVVSPLNISWSDIGSWDNIYEFLEKDENRNVKCGNVLDLDTQGCLILGSKRLISTIGVKDLLIVDTEDALLIGKRGQSQKVKMLVENLKRKGIKQHSEHLLVHYPWGSLYSIGEGDGYSLKRILVHPRNKTVGSSLSGRYWMTMGGVAKVTVNQEAFFLERGKYSYIPPCEEWILENLDQVPLEIIEVELLNSPSYKSDFSFSRMNQQGALQNATT